MKTALFNWRSHSGTHYLVKYSIWDRIKLLFQGVSTITAFPTEGSLSHAIHLLNYYYPNKWATLQADEIFNVGDYYINEAPIVFVSKTEMFKINDLLKANKKKFKYVGVVFSHYHIGFRFGN